MIHRRSALAGLLAAPFLVPAGALDPFRPNRRWATRAVMDFRRHITAAEVAAGRLFDPPPDGPLHVMPDGKLFPLASYREVRPADLLKKTVLYEPRGGGVWLPEGEQWFPPAEVEYFSSSLRPMIFWPENRRFTDWLNETPAPRIAA